MNGDAVRAALAELGATEDELAREWDVAPRTVYRWCASGCRRHIAVCFDAVLRLKRAGLPWRKWEVAIGIKDGRVVQLTDAEAIERHRLLSGHYLPRKHSVVGPCV